MRKTGERRRSESVVGQRYRGAPGRPIVRDQPTLVAPDDANPDDTVVCEQCGTRVMMLVWGQPRAHAPGGYRSSARRGRYNCEGSGTLS